MSDIDWSPPRVLYYHMCGDAKVIAAIKAWTEASGISPTGGTDDNTSTFFGGVFTTEQIDSIRLRLGALSAVVEEVVMFALCTDPERLTTYKAWLKDNGVRVYHEALTQPGGFYVAYYRPEDVEKVTVEYMGPPPMAEEPCVLP